MTGPTRSRVWLSSMACLVVCGALATSGCDKESKDCDQAALKKLLADAPAEVPVEGVSAEAEDKERARISAGIRAACPRSPEWMAARMKREYEGSLADTDERAAWLGGDEPEKERLASASIRERACPNFEKVSAEAMKLEGRSLDVKAELPPHDLGRHFFESCSLAKHGLYVSWPEGKERGPTSIFDFSVFLFLKDSGVDDETAAGLARGLGRTAPDTGE